MKKKGLHFVPNQLRFEHGGVRINLVELLVIIALFKPFWKICEGLATVNELHELGRKITGRMRRARRISDILNDSLRKTAMSFDDVREMHTKEIIKVVKSSSTDVTLLLERYRPETLLLKLESGRAQDAISEELAEIIWSERLGISMETLKNYLKGSMAQFQRELLSEIGKDRDLLNLVLVKLEIENHQVLLREIRGFLGEVIHLENAEWILRRGYREIPPKPFRRGGPLWTDFQSGIIVEREEMNRVLHILQTDKTPLIVGVPGSGKTVLARNIAFELIRSGESVYLYDLVESGSETPRLLVEIYEDIMKVDKPDNYVIIENTHLKAEEFNVLLSKVKRCRDVKLIFTARPSFRNIIRQDWKMFHSRNYLEEVCQCVELPMWHRLSEKRRISNLIDDILQTVAEETVQLMSDDDIEWMKRECAGNLVYLGYYATSWEPRISRERWNKKISDKVRAHLDIQSGELRAASIILAIAPFSQYEIPVAEAFLERLSNVKAVAWLTALGRIVSKDRYCRLHHPMEAKKYLEVAENYPQMLYKNRMILRDRNVNPDDYTNGMLELYLKDLPDEYQTVLFRLPIDKLEALFEKTDIASFLLEQLEEKTLPEIGYFLSRIFNNSASVGEKIIIKTLSRDRIRSIFSQKLLAEINELSENRIRKPSEYETAGFYARVCSSTDNVRRAAFPLLLLMKQKIEAIAKNYGAACAGNHIRYLAMISGKVRHRRMTLRELCTAIRPLLNQSDVHEFQKFLRHIYSSRRGGDRKVVMELLGSMLSDSAVRERFRSQKEQLYLWTIHKISKIDYEFASELDPNLSNVSGWKELVTEQQKGIKLIRKLKTIRIDPKIFWEASIDRWPWLNPKKLFLVKRLAQAEEAFAKRNPVACVETCKAIVSQTQKLFEHDVVTLEGLQRLARDERDLLAKTQQYIMNLRSHTRDYIEKGMPVAEVCWSLTRRLVITLLGGKVVLELCGKKL